MMRIKPSLPHSSEIVNLVSPKSSYIFQIGQDKLQGLDFDAIFNSCTNFGACETLQISEDLFGVPVVTINQAFV